MTDHIIKAAREAGFDCAPDGHIYNAGTYDQAPLDEQITRFYAIAYQQGLERAAEICFKQAAYMGLSDPIDRQRVLDCAAAIRAHAQNIDMTAASCTKSEGN